MSIQVEKRMHIAEDRARRLKELATAKGTTEDVLLEEALDLLFRKNETDETLQASWELLHELEAESGPILPSTTPTIRPEDTVFLGGTPLHIYH